jgi:hypothetical protein
MQPVPGGIGQLRRRAGAERPTRDLDMAGSAVTKEKPSPPITALGWTTTRAPMRTRARMRAPGWISPPGPIRAPGATVTWGPSREPAPISAPAPITQSAPIPDALAQSRRGVDHRRGMHALGVGRLVEELREARHGEAPARREDRGLQPRAAPVGARPEQRRPRPPAPQRLAPIGASATARSPGPAEAGSAARSMESDRSPSASAPSASAIRAMVGMAASPIASGT